MQRDGFGAEQADKRMASQPMTNEERAARATLVVANEGTEEELTNEVRVGSRLHLGPGAVVEERCSGETRVREDRTRVLTGSATRSFRLHGVACTILPR